MSLTSSDGSITAGTIVTSGGGGTHDAGGSTGGAGGSVTLSAAGGTHTISVGDITAAGGTGSANDTANGVGGTGAAGGTVLVTNTATGNTTTQGIDTHGGAAGAGGAGNSDGGIGGAAGSITVTSSGGTVAVGNLRATGGAGGCRTAQGRRVAAAPPRRSHCASARRLPARWISPPRQRSRAQASLRTEARVGHHRARRRNGENISLTDTLLTRPTNGNVVRSGIETRPSITGTGTTTLSGWAGNATVQPHGGRRRRHRQRRDTTLHGAAASNT